MSKMGTIDLIYTIKNTHNGHLRPDPYGSTTVVDKHSIHAPENTNPIFGYYNYMS